MHLTLPASESKIVVHAGKPALGVVRVSGKPGACKAQMSRFDSDLRLHVELSQALDNRLGSTDERGKQCLFH